MSPFDNLQEEIGQNDSCSETRVPEYASIDSSILSDSSSDGGFKAGIFPLAPKGKDFLIFYIDM